MHDMAQGQPGIAGAAGLAGIIIHVSVAGSHLKLMNGFEKNGQLSFY